MIGTTLTVAVNAVNKVLTRVSDSEPFSATYFLQEATTEYTLTIKHTIPASRTAGSKESHLVRLDVMEYDAEDALLRKQSVWVVMEATNGRQESTNLGYYAQGLFGLLDSTNVGKVLGRDS